MVVAFIVGGTAGDTVGQATVEALAAVTVGGTTGQVTAWVVLCELSTTCRYELSQAIDSWKHKHKSAPDRLSGADRIEKVARLESIRLEGISRFHHPNKKAETSHHMRGEVSW